MLHDSTVVTLEYVAYLLNARHIQLVALHSFTRAVAIFYMILKAKLKLARTNIVFGQRKRAAAKRKKMLDEFENVRRPLFAGIGAKVMAAVLDETAGQEYPGEALLFDADICVGFIIFQHDVVARLVLLDECILQQERIRLCLYHRKLDPAGMTDHNTGAIESVFALAKVARQPVAQVFGLAYIQNPPPLIDETVDPRQAGNDRNQLLKIFGTHTNPKLSPIRQIEGKKFD